MDYYYHPDVLARVVRAGEDARSASHPKLRNRRDTLEILSTMLEILMSEGGVTKTRLMNQANLNPISFQRYIMMLECAGAIESIEDGPRLIYKPTPRAASLRLLLALLSNILNPDPEIIREYRKVYEAIRSALESTGFEVRSVHDGSEAVLDGIAERDECRVGFMVALSKDPLTLPRLALYANLSQSNELKELDDVIIVTDNEEWVRGLIASGATVTSTGSLREVLRGVC
ncbi:hypothetical protein Pyrfu_1811 [Pyrolobus fumarii 1A]|uniref:ArnR1-like winged helix-turn-helix domain-containing protein n=1 Tax=Pyrolobus fumarii (strain DSM 11204 / 1A) TaxID=694429 RepID=G0ECU5_PYRF1|nr:winged helix-turn-helix domain-containing protein [Pyrolobus fumarii]AEM39665.1 hypothetical protein Pyrfu_1811 [Pyrolobus fumarii 1A]